MNGKFAVLLSLSVLLVGSAAPSFAAPRKISADQVYKSPKHIFTIVAPHPNSGTFDFSGWQVLYESEKGNHEMVTFADYDFGQTYRAGIVEMGETTANLDAIAQLVAVSRKHQVGVPFEFVDETRVSTKFGQGLLRVYSMKGGSLDLEGRGGEKPKFHDSFVAVLLVPQESRIVFAVSQDDHVTESVTDEAWKKSLKDEVQAFFATMTLGE